MLKPTLALVASLAVFVAPAQQEKPSELARRCELAGQEPIPLGHASDLPPALAAVQEELGARGPGALPELVAALPHGRAVRLIAPALLARHPGDLARSALTQLVIDPDADVARRAADGLGQVGGAEVVAPLVAAASDDRPSVRHAALNALVHLGAADRALEAALDALALADAPSRMSAAQLLAELRGSANLARAVDALGQRLAIEPRQDVRVHISRSRAIVEARLGR